MDTKFQRTAPYMKYLMPTSKGLSLLRKSKRQPLKFHPQGDMIAAMECSKASNKNDGKELEHSHHAHSKKGKKLNEK